MDKQSTQERPVIHITIDKIVMNFERVGLVVNANGNVVVKGDRGLVGKYEEDVVQVIKTHFQHDL